MRQCPAQRGTNFVLRQAVAWMALSGIGIALVAPASSSILADMFPESSRGTAFGIMFFIGNVGAAQPLHSCRSPAPELQRHHSSKVELG